MVIILNIIITTVIIIITMLIIIITQITRTMLITIITRIITQTIVITIRTIRITITQTIVITIATTITLTIITLNMAINIAVFVPEGIVLASDDFAEIRFKDDGFTNSHVSRTFILWDCYAISFLNVGYVNGLPIAFYINQWIGTHQKSDFDNLQLLANEIVSYFQSLCKEFDIDFYLAGYEKNYSHPTVLLQTKGERFSINLDRDSNCVYNYHAVGRVEWLNKIMMASSYNDGHPKHPHNINNQPVEIDFSKYSMIDAANFANFIINTSRELDVFCQFKQSIGPNITMVLIQPYSGAKLKY